MCTFSLKLSIAQWCSNYHPYFYNKEMETQGNHLPNVTMTIGGGSRVKVRTTWLFKANALMGTTIEPSESKGFSLNSQSLPLRYAKSSRKRSLNITDQLIWWVTQSYLLVSYRKVMHMWKEHSPDNPKCSRPPLQVQPLAPFSFHSHSLLRPAFSKGTQFSK